jgi:steroid delta-isomerase-like uncharacterized protein
MTTPEDNKALVRRWIAEVWNQGRLEVANDLFAPTYTHRTPTNTYPNLEAFKDMIANFRTGVPDVQVTIQDLLTDGDKVITRWLLTGTHRGPLFGVAATGKRISHSGITIQRVAAGKIVESWAEFDAAGLRQYLTTPI